MEISERYKLRCWSVAFETPFLELEGTEEAMDRMNEGITSSYWDWFEILSVDLKILQLPVGNQMLLFNLVVRIDLEAVNGETMEEEWKGMGDEIIAALRGFVESKDPEYMVIAMEEEKDDDKRLQ